jgi:hypothetical protein
MRKTVLALVALISFGGYALANMLLVPPPGPTYVGPGDIVSGAWMWGGLRCYSAATATGSTKALTIRRASDSTTSDIVCKTDGTLDVATAGTFCASTTCFATKIWDQSGATKCTSGTVVCDLVPSGGTGTQPQLIFSCLGSLPCLRYVSSSSQCMLSNVSFSAQAQPVTVSTVGNRTASASTNRIIFSQGNFGSDPTIYGPGGTANAWIYNAGSGVTATANDNAVHAANAVFNGASSTINIDGSETAGSAGTNGFIVAKISAGCSIGGGAFLDGDWYEGGLWPVGFTSGNRTSMNSNQHTFWGF